MYPERARVTDAEALQENGAAPVLAVERSRRSLSTSSYPPKRSSLRESGT